MSLGPFQEALGAMFALINEMEMTIKINTLIIFGNCAHLMGWKFNSLKARLCPLKSEREKKKNVGSLTKKHTTNMKGW